MIAELRAECAAIDEALHVLEPLARNRGRGRPPKWMQAMQASRADAPRPKQTRTLSAEAKRRMAEAQKKRWAAYREAHGRNKAAS